MKSYVKRLNDISEKILDGKASARQLPASTVCAVAGGAPAQDSHSRADEHKVSRRTVGRCLNSVAYGELQTFLCILGMTFENFAVERPDYFSSFIGWDENKKRVSYYFDGKPLKQSTDCLVSKRVYTWGWLGHPPHFLMVPAPPVPVPSTAWQSLRNGIQNHYFLRPFYQYAVKGYNMATLLSLQLGAKDHASGNNKYVSIERMELKAVCPKVKVEYTDCLPHQGMLGHMDVLLAVFLPDYLYSLNNMANFLNSGTTRLRMMISVRDVLSDVVELMPGSPLAVDVRYRDECKSYFLFWDAVTSGTHRIRKMGADGTVKETNKFINNGQRVKAIEGMFDKLGGGFHVDSQKLLIYVGAKQITEELRLQLIEPLAIDIIEATIRPQFPKGSKHKWTKTGPCNDRLFLSSQGGLLSKVVKRSVGKLKWEEKVCDANGDQFDDDAQYMEFQAKIGKTYKSTDRFLRNHDKVAQLPIFFGA